MRLYSSFFSTENIHSLFFDMSNNIHERACVSPEAVLGSGNTFGPNCFIDSGVTIGSNNCFAPGVVVYKGTTIGDNNRFHAGAVIGDLPQDAAFEDQDSFVSIGNNNTIRENCTIHKGTKPGTCTTVGNDTFLMVNTHLAHNCVVNDGVICANNVALGGYVEVGKKAFISAGVVVHQFCKIGSLTIISGLTAIGKDVPPFMLCMGKPGLVHGLNTVGLKRAGISSEDRMELKRAFKLIYRSGLSLDESLAQLETGEHGPLVQELAGFIKNASRGIALEASASSKTS